MKKRRLLLPTAAALLAATPALAGQACSKVNAIINPANQTVPEVSVVNGLRIPTTVTLDGTNSNPKNKVTCQWRSTDIPQIAIQNPNSCTASFTAPEVGPSGQDFHFGLKVTSAESGCTTETDTKSTTVSVTDVVSNLPPVASADVLPTATVNEGTVVTLDGSASSDPNGDSLTYAWTQIGSGTPVTLNNPTSPIATFTAPNDAYPIGESLTFRLTVSDGTLSSSTEKIVNVVWVNDPPQAVVNCPATVNEGASIALDGSISSDLDNGIASFAWSQLQGLPNANLTGVDLAAPSITFTAPSLTSAPYDTMKFGLTVTDNGNLSSSAECDVKVLDVTPPDISGAINITAEATSASGATVTFTPTAHDAYYGDVDVTCDPVSGRTFALGEATVKCSASDKATPPNMAEATFMVTVVDTTPPAVTAPADVTMEATGPQTSVTTGTATATDAVGVASLTSDAPATFPVGTTDVTWTAKDAARNTGTAIQKITITDTTPPSISGVPGNTKAEATGSTGAAVTYTMPTATDLVDGPITVICDKASGGTFALGDTTVTCNASDKAGNKAESKFTVTVQDTTPPVIKTHTVVAAEATSASGAVVTYSGPATTDIVDGDGIATCAPASGSTFALGETTVSCTASDKAGNAAIPTTFKVTVKDTTPPDLTLPGAIGPIEGNTLGGATISYIASALDLVDGSVGITCDKASGSVFPVGTTKVNCSATDAHNNNATGSFDVTVKDTTAPVITFGGSIADGSSFYFGSVPAAPTCTASDVVSGTVPCTVTGYSTTVGTHILTATATDNAGNTATSGRTYTVNPWTLNGFYKPIDMNGITNTVKGGSTVPMKFEVFAGATELTSTSSISSITTLPVSCNTMSAAEDAVPADALATGGTVLRYDTTAGQFIFNWQTPKSAGACYVVTATTQDGSKISANFKLK